MLTDLYLTGQIEDKEGKPHRSSVASPDDPVLSAACVQIGVTGRKDWAVLIAENERKARRVVRDQLKATGWLLVHRPIFGIIPTGRLVLSDKDSVSGLADQVTDALFNAMDGRPADPRPLAVGLLAVLGQMPTVLSFKESSCRRQQIRELISAAIAPIMGRQQAIEICLERTRERAPFGVLGGLPPQ